MDNSTTELEDPTTLAGAQTVLCLGAPQEFTADICAYTPNPDSEFDLDEDWVYEPLSFKRTARLIDPSSGVVIAEHEVVSEAEPCPDELFFKKSSDHFDASLPSLDSFESWVLTELG